ncbi:MAG TPA: hypothetical protein VHE83_10960 [Mycobacteriales bacterium]|nr:hypothetical protein [Mycobacteriales bacterium]
MAGGSLDAFVADRSPVWAELDNLSARARTSRLGAADVLRLADRYRGAAADLALARRRYAGNPVVASLEDVVARGREAVYGVPRTTPLAAVVRFVVSGWWSLVRARLRETATALGVVLVAGVASAVWAHTSPSAAERTLPPSLRRASLDPALYGLPRGAPGNGHSWTALAALAVAVLALVAGVLAGIGTVVVLAATGLALGVPAGLALSVHGGTWAAALGADGALAMLLVAIVAAHGLRLGRVLVDPGEVDRASAVRFAARDGALALAGALPWFGIAALLAALARSTSLTAAAPAGIAAVVALVAGTFILGRSD